MITIETLRQMKARGEKIACLTAYDYPTARLLDQAGIELILVGDSAANVVAGETTTLPITMEEMLYHTRIVSRAVKNALVIADMPFLSFQVSTAETVYNAGRFLKCGARGVKLEGCSQIADSIRRLVEIGIPVMGHLGLTPQSVHQLGGYKLQGATETEAAAMVKAGQTLETLGCFAVVLEKIPRALAGQITRALQIPTIGIGAGPDCDGQILVLHDMLGLFEDYHPRFVKKYAALAGVISQAVSQYRLEVKEGTFPGVEHSFE